MMEKGRKKLVVLGAGPAGLALAMKWLQRPQLKADVAVLEKSDQVGGLAASFEHEGLIFDYGSHRLHPSTSPEILRELQNLLAGELLDQPRYGRIRLFDRFVQFPLKPLELMCKLPPAFVAGFLRDSLVKPFMRREEPVSFADVLENGLGKTFCESFYFPYAEKLWGLAPEQIAAVQAQRRVAANSFWKMAAKVLYKMPGLRRPGAGRFFYPAKGFGQISRVLAQEVQRLGGSLTTRVQIDRIEQQTDGSWIVHQQGGASLQADMLFSTIPLTVLVRLIHPVAPAAVMQTVEALRFRAMVLHYVILETDQFTPFDAHYFPQKDLIFSRLSETKNYRRAVEPAGRTGLCFEIPCNPDSPVWNQTDAEITAHVLTDLRKAALPVQCRVIDSFSKRAPFVYPVYDLAFADRLQTLEDYLSRFPRLIRLGRQGLFVHDNTHHTIDMAYKAAQCLDDDGRWSAGQWQRHLESFAQNVVED
ncbi:MAG TPA: FAD-dependent oxidoreductase [bacterium]|nr:FAD-dependent oxidoreductase [bacterium]